MKTKFLFLFFICLSWSAQATQQFKRDNQLSSGEFKKISASDYCRFLNEVTVSNPTDFYDEKLENSLTTACITRLGTCGHYNYEVLPGKEEICVPFLSWTAAAAYCQWRGMFEEVVPRGKNSISNPDPFLKSNLLAFYLVKENTYAYQANGPEVLASEEVLNEMIADALVLMAAGLGVEATREPLSERVEGSQEHRANLSTLEQQGESEHFKKKKALLEKVEEGIRRLTERSVEKQQQRYLPAETLWESHEAAWKAHEAAYEDLEQRKIEEAVTLEKLQQATDARSDDAREKTRLGKLKKRLEQTAKALGYIPEPHAQAGAIGLEKVADIVAIAQKIWVVTNHFFADQEHQKAIQSREEAQDKAHQASLSIITFEKQLQDQERICLEKETDSTKELAAILHLHAGWREGEWRHWGRQLQSVLHPEKVRAEQEIQELIHFASRHVDDVTKVTAELWQQRIEESRQELKKRTQEGELKVACLQCAYDQVEKKAEQAAEEVIRIHQQLTLAQQRKKELQEAMEQFLEEQGEKNHQETLEAKRKEFCDNFDNLIKTQAEVDQLQVAWERQLQEQRLLRCHAFKASQPLTREKKLQHRLHQRLQGALQIDQDLFRQYWPAYDLTYRPYLQWSLPFQRKEVAMKPDPILNEERESLARASVEPPLEDQEELEALGERYYFEMLQRSALFLASLRKKAAASLQTEELHSSGLEHPGKETPSLSTREHNKEQKSLLDPYEELMEWNKKQLIHPTAAEQERWKIFDQLQHVERESRRLAGKIQQSKKEDQEDSETGTLFSFVTRGSVHKASKARSVLSIFSTRTTTTTADSQVEKVQASSLEEQWKEVRAQEKELLDQWLSLVQKAEEERLARGGVALCSKELAIQLWERADLEILKIKKAQEEILLEKQNAAALAQRWDKNTARWKACEEADRATEEYQDIQNRLILLAKQKGDLAAKQVKMTQLEAELETASIRQQECQKAWEVLAQEHHSTQARDAAPSPGGFQSQQSEKSVLSKAFLKLQEFDRAVVVRWYQLQECLKIERGEEAMAPEDAAFVKDPASFETLLSHYLEPEQRKAFQNAPYIDPAGKDPSSKNYRRGVIKVALRTARENKPGAVEGWAARVRLKENLLATKETLLNNPKTSSKEAAQLRDTLAQERSMLQAEKEGQLVFEKEKKRLDSIERIWRSILEAAQKEGLQRVAAAVKAYQQGDPLPWHDTLTQKERGEYNERMELKNSRYRQELHAEEEFLEETKKILEEEQLKMEKRTKGFFGAVPLQKEMSETLEAAQKYYQRRTEILKRRKVMRSFAEMTEDERGHYHCLPQDLKLIDHRFEKLKLLKEVKKDQQRTLIKNEGVKALVQKSNRDEVRCYRQYVAIIEAEAMALRDEKIAMSWTEQGLQWRSAIETAVEDHDRSHEQKKQGYHDEARYYYHCALASEAEATAVIHKDLAEQERQRSIYRAWQKILKNHEKIKEEERTGNKEVACSLRHDVALEMKALALANNDKEEAMRQEEIIGILKNRLSVYQDTQEDESEVERDRARCLRYHAAALEAQTIALTRQDAVEARRQKDIATAWDKAASAYKIVYYNRRDGYHRGVTDYDKDAANYETLAEALINKDDRRAKKQKEIIRKRKDNRKFTGIFDDENIFDDEDKNGDIFRDAIEDILESF